MATMRRIPEDEASPEVREAYEQIKAGFGAGRVPPAYQVLANNPRMLAAAVENRARIMDEGELDPLLKEWLAWATVTLEKNTFGIHVHTARLKKLGVSDAQILEGLSVLQYFTGISTLINGLAMDHDIAPEVLETLGIDGE